MSCPGIRGERLEKSGREAWNDSLINPEFPPYFSDLFRLEGNQKETFKV
jgi:hypothetical protein